MWKKVLFLLLAGIVVVIGGGLAFLCLVKPAHAPASQVKVALTPERIARGQYLFERVCDCAGCHSQRDFTRVGGPEVAGRRGAGTVMSDFLIGLPGVVVAPNITPDVETGIGSWSDGEKIRAIREGVDKDGRPLFPLMPYTGYRAMSDQDAEALVAYMDTLPPIHNPLSKTSLAFPVNLMIRLAPQPAGTVPPPETGDRFKYGRYLVTIAGCSECHTPAEKGQPVPGMEYAGGQVFATKAGTVLTANITPDLDTGIGKWSEEFFLKKIYDYKEYAEHGAPPLAGPQAFTLMPWLAYSGLRPEDLSAIYTYLHSLKPIRHSVETHPGSSKTAEAL
ncbi:MAG TPA: cytochrome c [Bryobacteraceae bacterium]|nr:cytochrome c [Bryobacteraceae bacterium]